MNSQLQLEINGRQVRPTPVFAAYWRFAAERQHIFLARHLSGNPVSSEDSVLRQYRFTNAYRASDRVSQFLIRNVIYDGHHEQDYENTFFRILLFKLFNKIETWQLLEQSNGPLRIQNFSFKAYGATLSRAINENRRIYSAAYIMPSCGRVFGYQRKHLNHLKLIEWMLSEAFAERIAKCVSMNEAYRLLLTVPSFGPFLAYQFVTDLNYSEITNFSESEFVVAGPGAIDGIQKCFENADDVSAAQIIAYMAENQSRFFSMFELDFTTLWGRPLQYIDCQNLFCEISKYARVAFPDIKGTTNRTRIKQKFRPNPCVIPKPWYPPKWGINENMEHRSTEPSIYDGSDKAIDVQLTLV